MYVAQQRIYLTEKEGIFLVLPNKRMVSLFWISGLNELKNLGPWNRIEKFRILVRQGGM